MSFLVTSPKSINLHSKIGSVSTIFSSSFYASLDADLFLSSNLARNYEFGLRVELPFFDCEKAEDILRLISGLFSLVSIEIKGGDSSTGDSSFSASPSFGCTSFIFSG